MNTVRGQGSGATVWLRRIAACVLALAVAASALLSAYAGIARGRAVDLAIATGWAGGDAYAVKADELYWANPQAAPWRRIESLASRAVASSPLNARAVRLAGLAKGAGGDAAAELEALELAHKLTRRDVGTHVLFINRMAKGGNLQGTLEHYDLALRTKQESSALLFPALVRAMASPEVQREFAVLIRKRPPWLIPTLQHLAAETPDPTVVARALELAGNLPEGQLYRDVEATMLGRLMTKRGPLATRDYYLTLAGTSAADLTRVKLAPTTSRSWRAPIAWAAVSSADSGGSFVTDRRTGDFRLEGSTAPGTRGTIARKFLFLKPGTYRLIAAGEYSGDPSGGLSVVVNCVGDGRPRPFWRDRIRGRAALMPLAISASCPFQLLEIELDSGKGQSGSSAILRSLQFA